MASNFQNEDYEALRNQCLTQKQLFCDPSFPASSQSLGFNILGLNSAKAKGVEWKRPGELCSKPQFIVSGATCADVCQGALGDCWLMAAIASLSMEKEILARVIYPEQNFTDNYAGIFRFRLWQFGKWEEVVIDDRLPTRSGQLLFVKSAEQNEFWSALLEKAYAKVNGCYENLWGGFASEAQEDFTGGIAEWFTLKEAPPNLFDIMKKALSRDSFLSTFISVNNRGTETRNVESLVENHVYSITDANEVQTKQGQYKLVRLRNPWGKVEWNGAWSDGSAEWNQVSPEDKDMLFRQANDGEFWMTYADFIQRYTKLEICNLTPNVTGDGNLEGCNFCQFEDTWKVGTTAGGCNNFQASFSTNPQFRVKLNIDSQGDGKCSALIALMQKGARTAKQTGFKGWAIGFHIYRVPDKYIGKQNVRLGGDDLKKPVDKSKFEFKREVYKRFDFPLAEYIIVPSTFEPNQEASFLLRVFSEK